MIDPAVCLHEQRPIVVTVELAITTIGSIEAATLMAMKYAVKYAASFTATALLLQFVSA